MAKTKADLRTNLYMQAGSVATNGLAIASSKTMPRKLVEVLGFLLFTITNNMTEPHSDNLTCRLRQRRQMLRRLIQPPGAVSTMSKLRIALRDHHANILNDTLTGDLLVQVQADRGGLMPDLLTH